MLAGGAALEDAFDRAPQHGHQAVILRSIYTDPLMARLDASIREAEAEARTDAEKLHLKVERAIYDFLREFVALEKTSSAQSWMKSSPGWTKMSAAAR